ncbi:MAG: ABC transporter permease [Bacteroidales bacterium]|nr:ABC transporter permease [Bacteroidales bacterium]
MKELVNFIKKEFKHILRDKRTLLILFGMPIIQILLFGYVISTDIKDAGIAILDLSKDESTQEITSKLVSSGYFIINENLKSYDQIEEIFKQGNVKEVIVFEQDFDKKLTSTNSADIQLIADATDANTANMIVFYTSGIIMDYVNYLNKNIDIPLKINVNERMLYNEELKSSFMFVPGIMAMILMLISAMMTSISIAREKELGTMEILLVSPLKPVQIVIGKVAPYFILSFVNAISILIIGYFVFGVPISGSLILLLGESMLFILMALSLGILISTVAKTQQFAMMASMFALMLPTMLLSGFVYPIENMPGWLQVICHIMPPKYFITIVKGIMLKGTGILFIWKETLILFGFTIFFIAMSVKKFKIRLE